MWLLGALLAPAAAQLLPAGTVDVPSPRKGDCGDEGPATYVYRLSEKEPNDIFPDVCAKLGKATVHFNDPCQWAHGQAQLTTAHFTNMCKGATRVIHWHNTADEWGYVNKGLLQTFVASPNGLPWPSSNNVLEPKGVWFFPSGWLHGLMCLTPEEEGGCEFTIVFASPQAAEPNGHNLGTTFAQAPDNVAAAALGMDLESYLEARPGFARTAHSVHYTNSNMTAPIVTAVAPGDCEPHCPRVVETLAAPAAVQARAVEQEVPSVAGVRIFQIRQAQFSFARTMSQERVELRPGAHRPMVWTSADAVLVVLEGSITFGLEGGVLGKEAHLAFVNETIGAGDVAYIPNGRAYWFQEATGTSRAETITVFNVGDWRNIEMAQSLQLMPEVVTRSNLRLKAPLTMTNLQSVPVADARSPMLVAAAAALAASLLLAIGVLVRHRRQRYQQNRPLLA